MSRAQTSLLPRLAPALVSALGSLGLAGAFAYVGALVLSTRSGFEQISEFMIGRSDQEMSYGFLLVAVPYVLLLSHLYLRTRLGDWLLKRGRLDQAQAYASSRLGRNPLRGKREVLAHRIALAKVHAWRCDYDAAWEVLEGQVGPDGQTPRRGPFALEWHRWRLEVALRQENHLRARAAAEAAGEASGPKEERAQVEACIAELAVREGDAQAYDAALRRGGWAKAGEARLAWARAMGGRRFGAGSEELQQTMEALRTARPALEAELPGRRLELAALEAALLAASDRVEEARAMLRSTQDAQGEADPRARHFFEKVYSELNDG